MYPDHPIIAVEHGGGFMCVMNVVVLGVFEASRVWGNNLIFGPPRV